MGEYNIFIHRNFTCTFSIYSDENHDIPHLKTIFWSMTFSLGFPFFYGDEIIGQL